MTRNYKLSDELFEIIVDAYHESRLFFSMEARANELSDLNYYDWLNKNGITRIENSDGVGFFVETEEDITQLILTYLK